MFLPEDCGKTTGGMFFSKRNVTNLELADEVTDESEVLDALLRVASSVF